jgi:acyl-[acyl-carrier-protein]-phospholipid O-acyltransferase/long-chain-fatty-acid--[acyl-carrier-protein] ligase
MLLTQSRFFPLFLVQFLATFNDTFFKTAVVMLIVFKRAAAEGNVAGVLSALVWALYMLPFFALSASAGQLSDRLEKVRLMRWIKAVDLALAAVVCAGFFADDLTILLPALALKGATSTFFGPVKYAILPERLPPEQLIAANSLVEGGTYLAILLGTIAGGILILQNHGPMLVGAVFVVVAVTGMIAAFFLTPTVAANPHIQLKWTIATETAAILRTASADRMTLWAIIGVSWFWVFGTVIMSELPALTNEVMTGTGEIVPLLLTVFSAGTGVGLWFFALLLKGSVSTRYVPIAGLLMSLGSVDVWLACMALEPSASPLGPLAFFSDPARLRIVADLFLVAAAGGGFTVPLSAMLQLRTQGHERSRMIAASNAVNALLTVLALGAAIVALSSGLPLPELFVGMAVLNMIAAITLSLLLNRR